MSMTRKEAIKVLKNGGIEVCGEADRISEFIAALGVALDALIPLTRENELEAENRELKERIVNWRKYMAPTREQVEKVLPGCDFCKIELDDYPYIVAHSDYSSSDTCYEPSFCPVCGKPLTDEAVKMVMERLEDLHEEN